jgi:hypothetical protein
MAHYVMACEGPYPAMPIKQGPLRRGWRLGASMSEPIPQPLTYTLDVDYPGKPKAMYQAEAVPLMRDDVVEALTKAGVDNIQYFDAVILNPKTGEEHRNYKAFNIVGLVAAAEMQQSRVMEGSTSTIGDVDFDELVIDESKARGHLMFRLAECISAIVVDEPVKAAIEAAGIPGFVFYGPGEWSG